ncbi:hypothetical protein CJU90_3993 [Yarrowia sp. C11]|nr:hypothetical protein CKK34_5605 [Yarrowia sp. E02]KAG5367688.1 hypothetical protein CJU90_3993 [Yarrowia sp. C11]
MSDGSPEKIEQLEKDLNGLRAFRASLESVRLLTESIKHDIETSRDNHETMKKTLADLQALLKELPVSEEE